MKNFDVRMAIQAAGLRHWMVAEKLGMREETFSRSLRKELTTDVKQRVFSAIEELKKAQIAV